MIIKTDKEGNITKISNRELKTRIMKSLNLKDTSSYKKVYDIFKLKLRTYERVFSNEKKSIINELYYSLTEKRIKYQRIMNMRAYNYKTIRKLSNESKFVKNTYDELNKYVLERFEGLLNTPTGKVIYKELKDNPVALEKALIDYADKAHDTEGNADFSTNESVSYEEDFDTTPYKNMGL